MRPERILMISQVLSACQLLSLAGLNNNQNALKWESKLNYVTVRRCLDVFHKLNWFDFKNVRWLLKYTTTNKYETTSLPVFVSDLCLVSFPVVEYTHVWPDLPELTGSIFGGASLSGGRQRSSRNFHRSSLFSLSSADIWTLEQLSV